MDENSNCFDLKVERDTFLNQLNESRKVEELTDVKLQMGDKLFPAHRNVLFHSSPVLKTLISDRWSTTNGCPISDQYVDAELMEDLLSFIYTGRIKLTPDNVHAVCVAAHFLQISTLLEPSVKYLCQLINVENVLTLFKFSTVCELEELNYSCLRFVNNNHENVLESELILELSFKDFKNLIFGLKKFWNKMLRENTFYFIVRWTEKNLPERLTELPVLLENIPLEELPLKFLSETVSTHPLVKESISGIETVSAALANYRTYSTYSTAPWKNNQNMIVLGGAGRGCTMSLFDSHSGVWKKLPTIPSDRAHYGVTTYNNKDIIVCGGCIFSAFTMYAYSASTVVTSSVMKFEWSTQTWTQLPEMPFACKNASAAICNDHLYVVGSYRVEPADETLDQKRVLRFSFKTKQWESVASTNKERAGGFIIEHKNHLYAFGGGSKTIEKYDPARDKWTVMTKLLSDKVTGVTMHQHKIHIYGGDGFKVYHPETNSFDYFPLSYLGYPSLVSLNGKLLAVGGMGDAQSNTDLICEFDFPTMEWIEFGKFDSKLSYHSTVVGAFY